MEVIEFKDTGINEVKEKVKERIKELNVGDPIIRIKITGTLKQGLTHGDLTFPQTEKIFVDNELDSKSLKEKLIKIRELRENRMSVREVAMKKLDTELKGKVSFDPTEFFNKLLSGVDDALEYLKVN